MHDMEETVKFGGGNLMLWSCMGWDGIGYATKIEGRMDAELYKAILKDEFLETLNYYGKSGNDIIFQQDNDPKHMSKKAQGCLQTMELQSSSGLHSILNTLEIISKGGWQGMKNLPIVLVNLQMLWEDIPKECQKLIESMPKRLAEVVRAKGGYTKY